MSATTMPTAATTEKAGWWTRFLAILIDAIGVGIVAGIIASLLGGDATSTQYQGLSTLLQAGAPAVPKADRPGGGGRDHPARPRAGLPDTGGDRRAWRRSHPRARRWHHDARRPRARPAPPSRARRDARGTARAAARDRAT